MFTQNNSKHTIFLEICGFVSARLGYLRLAFMTLLVCVVTGSSEADTIMIATESSAPPVALRAICNLQNGCRVKIALEDSMLVLIPSEGESK